MRPRRPLVRRRAGNLLLAGDQARTGARRYLPRARSPDIRQCPALACAAAAILLPTSLLGFLAHDQVSFGAWTHFAGVGLTALAATLAAVALTVVGARRNDGRTVLLGTAFTAMAALLALHGLATPGIILPYNGLVGFTGAATLPIGGAVLALSALPSLRRPRGVGRLLILQASLLLAIAGLGTACMLRPSLLNNIPKPGDPVALGGARRRGRLLRRPPPSRAADLSPHPTPRRPRRGRRLGLADGRRAAGDAAHLGGSGLVARPPARAVGIVAVGVQVALDLRRSAQSRPLSGDLRAAELVAEEEAFLGARVRALTMHLAEKDVSTEEHTRRVALRAVQVGEELGLPPHRLRAARDRRPAPRHRQAQRSRTRS